MVHLKCYKYHILFRVFITAIITSVCGLVFGFSSIKPILLRDKMFYNLCNNTMNIIEKIESCPEQILRMNSILFLLTGGLNVGTLLTGFFIDKFTSRVNILIGSILWVTSLFIFGCSTYFRILDQYFWWISHISFLFCGVSATLLFFVYMKYPREIPKIKELKGVHEFITSLLTTCWDLSIMWIIYFIADQTFIPLIYLFISLIILMLFPLIISFIFFDLPKLELNNKFDIQQEDDDYLIDNSIQNQSLYQQIFKIDIIIMYIYMINLMQHQSWWLTTIYDQILFLTKDRNIAETQNTIFSILMPTLAILFNFIFAKLLQNLLHAIGVLSLFTVIYTIIRYTNNVNLYYLMYCLWIPWRISSFTFYYSYFEKTTSKSKYSYFIMSIGFTIGGLLSFLTIYWNYLVEFYFNGSFFYINLFLDIFNFFSHILVISFILKKQNPNLYF